MPEDIYCFNDSTHDYAQPLPKNIGRFIMHESANAKPSDDKIESIKDDLKKATEKLSALNLTLNEAFIVCERERERERKREHERHFSFKHARMMPDSHDSDEKHKFDRSPRRSIDDIPKHEKRKSAQLTDYEFFLLTIGGISNQLKTQLKEIQLDNYFINIALLIKAGVPLSSILNIDRGWRDGFIIVLARLLSCRGKSFEVLSQASDKELQELSESSLYENNIPDFRKFLKSIIETRKDKIAPIKSQELEEAKAKLKSLNLTFDDAFQLREQEIYGSDKKRIAIEDQKKNS